MSDLLFATHTTNNFLSSFSIDRAVYESSQSTHVSLHTPIEPRRYLKRRETIAILKQCLKIWGNCWIPGRGRPPNHKEQTQPRWKCLQVINIFWQQVDWNHSQSSLRRSKRSARFYGFWNTAYVGKDESNLATNELENGSKNTIIPKEEECYEHLVPGGRVYNLARPSNHKSRVNNDQRRWEPRSPANGKLA